VIDRLVGVAVDARFVRFVRMTSCVKSDCWLPPSTLALHEEEVKKK
jgi:hypothetical protein